MNDEKKKILHEEYLIWKELGTKKYTQIRAKQFWTLLKIDAMGYYRGGARAIANKWLATIHFLAVVLTAIMVFFIFAITFPIFFNFIIRHVGLNWKTQLIGVSIISVVLYWTLYFLYSGVSEDIINRPIRAEVE